MELIESLNKWLLKVYPLLESHAVEKLDDDALSVISFIEDNLKQDNYYFKWDYEISEQKGSPCGTG